MKTLRTRAAIAGVLLTVSLQVACQEPPRFDPDLARNAPPVTEATVELLAKPVGTANVILRVQFTDGRSGTAVPIDGGAGRPVNLLDDGRAPDEKARDGIYTALVNVDVERFNAQVQRLREVGSHIDSIPVFDIRHLLETVPFRPELLQPLKVGVRAPAPHHSGFSISVDASRSLMVTDPGVVDDAANTFNFCTNGGTMLGPWTFGRLMTEIANEPVTGIDPAVLAEHWLTEWQSTQNINSFMIPSRPGAAGVLSVWPRLPNGRLDLARAPFRLLAIVNRLDLRDNTLYGGTNGGEARLVFGALNCGPNAQQSQGEPVEFLVIFEYGIRRSGCAGVKDWAQKWLDLGALMPGSPAYNTALKQLTDQFTLRDADPTRLPNRSALRQLRSNEDYLRPPIWELREARICTSSSTCSWLLEHDTTAQTPDVSLQHSSSLVNYINDNEAAILAGTHVVTLKYPVNWPFGGNFLGGGIKPGAGFPWNGPQNGPSFIVNLAARHLFALATCNGCHTVETDTSFVHISPRFAGSASQLSGFLTGITTTDPVDHTSHTFNDLQRRAIHLDATAHMSCGPRTPLAVDEFFIQSLAAATH